MLEILLGEAHIMTRDPLEAVGATLIPKDKHTPITCNTMHVVAYPYISLPMLIVRVSGLRGRVVMGLTSNQLPTEFLLSYEDGRSMTVTNNVPAYARNTSRRGSGVFLHQKHMYRNKITVENQSNWFH